MKVCDHRSSGFASESLNKLITWSDPELLRETYYVPQTKFAMPDASGNDFGMRRDDNAVMQWEGGLASGNLLSVVDQYVQILKSLLTLLIYGSRHGGWASWDQYSNLPIASTSNTSYGLGNFNYGNMANESTSNNIPYISENLLAHSSGQAVVLPNVLGAGEAEPAPLVTGTPSYDSYYAIDPATEELFNSFLAKTGGSYTYENQS